MIGRIPIPEPQEPAHSPIFELQDLLRDLYVHIRNKLQDRINQVFDEVSRDIGFVVATTVPMTFQIAEQGQVKGVAVPDASPLKGTLMDRALTGALQPMLKDRLPVAKPGDYTVYLIWAPALRFKLRRDWMEPAHLGRIAVDVTRVAEVKPAKELAWEVREPAHWFTPGAAISALEALHVSLLDEVYPELRLLDRVVAGRRSERVVLPEVKEPAHFRQFVSAIPELPREMLAELAQVLRRYGF